MDNPICVIVSKYVQIQRLGRPIGLHLPKPR